MCHSDHSGGCLWGFFTLPHDYTDFFNIYMKLTSISSGNWYGIMSPNVTFSDSKLVLHFVLNTNSATIKKQKQEVVLVQLHLANANNIGLLISFVVECVNE